MDRSKLDITQLQKRDPAAWTALLHSQGEVGDLIVTAVTAEPCHRASFVNHDRHVIRYILALADHSDPITFIGKRTNRSEALFYRDISHQLPFVAPRCWFTHVMEDSGWIVIEDVPNHYTPAKWAPIDIEYIIDCLTDLHVAFWHQTDELQSYDWLPHFIGRREDRYTWEMLRQEQAVYFEEGPAALISEHAINSAGRLAPTLLKAANGLAVMRSLGGWPGIISESHLSAAADLLDDPVPMLEPLLNLPATLLHGKPHNYHWRLNLFGATRLLDWKKAMIGPSVLDLISFVEQVDLLRLETDARHLCVRKEQPATEETIVDSYMLAMSGELDTQFNARLMRHAIPAARCLHVLTTWFPNFATWFSEMPDKYTWQRANRMSDEQLAGTVFQPMVEFRPYLAAVFKRFLHAYKTL